jgi:hypothetical protein
LAFHLSLSSRICYKNKILSTDEHGRTRTNTDNLHIFPDVGKALMKNSHYNSHQGTKEHQGLL